MENNNFFTTIGKIAQKPEETPLETSKVGVNDAILNLEIEQKQNQEKEQEAVLQTNNVTNEIINKPKADKTIMGMKPINFVLASLAVCTVAFIAYKKLKTIKKPIIKT